MNYNTIKKQCLERFFSRTNDKQREAIFQVNGSVLIIAGAGSGKTTVLCNRIANLLLFGDAYYSDFEPTLEAEDAAFLESYAGGSVENTPENVERLSRLIGFRRAKPWKILAVTFTNKAAAELKERLGKMNAPAEDVWASTFHSACVKILRRGIEELGYKSSFTIYDTDDSIRVIKDSMKYLQISDKAFNPKDVANKISRAKDKLIKPSDFPLVNPETGKSDYALEKIREVYIEYQKRLKAANALDFDDIIMKTVELLETSEAARQRWQSAFDYIMVDEYQDTNGAQYKLVSLLAQGSGNLCVVGDEDQSIYRFRGATIENILSFEKEFKSKVIKLEQNYRSTETILDAANAVIKNNTQRKDKALWSQLGQGDKISLNLFGDEQSEALFVADTIMKGKEAGGAWKDNAILYRTNVQSRTFELALSRQAIPYRIIGGTKFYERKEIRDILAYMSVLNNPFDTVRLKRIINEPKRGIGEATESEIFRVAEGIGISPIEVMQRADEFAGLQKKSKVLTELGGIFTELMSGIEDNTRSLDMLVDDIMAQTGYDAMLLKQGDEGFGRLENIKELKSGIINFMQENEEHALSDYLENVALITDMDSYEENDDKVVLMTMHGAKGLEFNSVFIVGAEENLFPSYRAANDPVEVEEERRLAYVAITRAKKNLYITHAKQRLIFGQTVRNKLSRFIKEIPEGDIEFTDHTPHVDPSTAKQRVKKIGYLQQAAMHEDHYAQPAASKTEFSVGDRVGHKIFGGGTVLAVTKMGNDHLLEIAFDKVGTKKIMANFAKITKE